jgi:hypothetical protein
VRLEPLTAAQSPFAQSTTEFAATVVRVADGAPVPDVDTVAGVAASFADVHRFTLIDAFNCVPDDFADDTVDAVPPEVTVVVHNPNQVCPLVWNTALRVQVPAVDPVIVGVAYTRPESSDTTFTTRISPVAGVNDPVVRVPPVVVDAVRTVPARVGIGPP